MASASSTEGCLWMLWYIRRVGLAENPNHFLSTVQVGIMLIGIWPRRSRRTIWTITRWASTRSYDRFSASSPT